MRRSYSYVMNTANVYATNPILRDPPFSSPEYTAFAAEVRARMSATSPEEYLDMFMIQESSHTWVTVSPP